MRRQKLIDEWHTSFEELKQAVANCSDDLFLVLPFFVKALSALEARLTLVEDEVD